MPLNICFRKQLQLIAIGFSVSLVVTIPNISISQNLSCLVSDAVDCSTPSVLSVSPVVGAYREVFKKACVNHDFCYRFGEATYGHTKAWCDANFLRDMERKCNNVSKWDVLSLGATYVGCRGAASAFYVAVSEGGNSAWRNSGSEFCEYDGPAKFCDANTETYEGCWTKEVSEERGGEISCPHGKAMTGLWCTGKYCDNKNLYCSPFNRSISEQPQSKRISEEQPNASFRVDTRDRPSVVVGIKCTGKYCDNIVGKIGYSPAVTTTGAWEWRPWVSEEGRQQVCGNRQFVTGIGCKGKYCDNISLHCSTFRLR